MNATDTLKEEIEKCAKLTAARFVEAFGLPLEPASTDWAAVAWHEDSIGLGMKPASSDHDEWWPIYQASLIAETERLCTESSIH